MCFKEFHEMNEMNGMNEQLLSIRVFDLYQFLREVYHNNLSANHPLLHFT